MSEKRITWIEMFIYAHQGRFSSTRTDYVYEVCLFFVSISLNKAIYHLVYDDEFSFTIINEYQLVVL